MNKRWFCSLLLACLLLSACAPASQSKKDDSQAADVHYKMAMAHMQGGNPTMALKELLQAVQKDPENSTIHVSLAQAYQQKKAYLQAERHYLKALELTLDEPRYQNNLGALYLDMERWDDAIELFDKASGNLLFERPHVAVAGKGYAFYRKGEYDKALLYYREAIALSPRFALVHFRRSEIYRDLKKPVEEKDALHKAIDIAPQFLQARYRLAELLIDSDELKAAEEQLLTIIDFAPTSDWGLQASDLMRSLP